MPDGTGGLASGLYWVATGKFPLQDVDEEDSRRGDRGLFRDEERVSGRLVGREPGDRREDKDY